MDEILNLIESVSEGFPSYFCMDLNLLNSDAYILVCQFATALFFTFEFNIRFHANCPGNIPSLKYISSTWVSGYLFSIFLCQE